MQFSCKGRLDNGDKTPQLDARMHAHLLRTKKSEQRKLYNASTVDIGLCN